MKLSRTLALIVGALVVPAVASAQAPDQTDPNAPTTTTNTTVNVPPPPPAPVPQPAPQPQTPVVVVNPNQPAPQSNTVISNPEGEEVYDSWNAPMFTTGAIVFAGSYGASAIVAAESDHVGADRLYVPVVGPWLALNDWGNCPIDQQRCDSTTTDKVLLVADGVFQAAGIVGMVGGILSPSHHRVITHTADTKVHVTPTHNGFAVFGRF